MLSPLHGLDTPNASRLGAAGAALEAGHLNEAARLLQSVQAQMPDHPEVLRLHAGLLSQRGRHNEAIRCMRLALAKRGNDAVYHNTLGTLLGAAGEYDEAICVLEYGCRLQPSLPLAWYNLGVMLTRAVRNDEATTALRQALALDPGNVGARALLADLMRTQGMADEAEAMYRALLQHQPWSGVAWWGLADLKRPLFGSEDILAMRNALTEPRTSMDDRIATGFALAKALDDAGMYVQSLETLHDAHALASQRRRWNPAAMSDALAGMRQTFSPPPVAAVAPLGHEVVFIVSLPRSGSTLIEQILASHSQVEGAGELVDLPQVLADESRHRGQPFPHWVKAMQPADWQRLGERYLERTARWRRSRPMFTDKLPNNWMYIGAIRAMLPHARIIGCRRDPLETCFACYRQYLPNGDYAHRFGDLAAFWHDFDISLREAQQASPDHVYEHVYEDLLADPERSIRQLLTFCGLPFEQGCLDFHANIRTVRSPSAAQVRQPLRQDTARLARYGSLLDALRQALDTVSVVDAGRRNEHQPP